MLELAGQEFREAGGTFDLAGAVNAGVQKPPSYLWRGQGGVGIAAKRVKSGSAASIAASLIAQVICWQVIALARSSYPNDCNRTSQENAKQRRWLRKISVPAGHRELRKGHNGTTSKTIQ
jgi:hypothetical protein